MPIGTQTPRYMSADPCGGGIVRYRANAGLLWGYFVPADIAGVAGGKHPAGRIWSGVPAGRIVWTQSLKGTIHPGRGGWQIGANRAKCTP